MMSESERGVPFMSLRRICKHATGNSAGAAESAASNTVTKAGKSSMKGGVIK